MEIVDRDVRDKRGSRFELFVYKPGEEFNGILSHLTKSCGGNVHEKGVVNITSSGDERNMCSQVADHGWNDYWYSHDAPASWICFDFKDKSLSLRHYTLKSGGNPYQPFVHWEIEGSNDGSPTGTWKSLDSRNAYVTKDFSGTFVVKSYSCTHVNSNEFFRFIRMRQSGKNMYGKDYLMLCNIEFFGTIKNPRTR
jgi:hypothetical protein